MLAVNDIEKAFSHGNPWLMKFRAISIPEKLERTHLNEWLDHVWIVDFEQVEVILEESEWKRFFPEEWLNNGLFRLGTSRLANLLLSEIKGEEMKFF